MIKAKSEVTIKETYILRTSIKSLIRVWESLGVGGAFPATLFKLLMPFM